MPETPKEKAKSADKESEERERSSWGEDQKRREYYYDDAHGYEVYEPEEDEKEDAD